MSDSPAAEEALSGHEQKDYSREATQASDTWLKNARVTADARLAATGFLDSPDVYRAMLTTYATYF